MIDSLAMSMPIVTWDRILDANFMEEIFIH